MSIPNVTGNSDNKQSQGIDSALRQENVPAAFSSSPSVSSAAQSALAAAAPSVPRTTNLPVVSIEIPPTTAPVPTPFQAAASSSSSKQSFFEAIHIRPEALQQMSREDLLKFFADLVKSCAEKQTLPEISKQEADLLSEMVLKICSGSADKPEEASALLGICRLINSKPEFYLTVTAGKAFVSALCKQSESFKEIDAGSAFLGHWMLAGLFQEHANEVETNTEIVQALARLAEGRIVTSLDQEQYNFLVTLIINHIIHDSIGHAKVLTANLRIPDLLNRFPMDEIDHDYEHERLYNVRMLSHPGIQLDQNTRTKLFQEWIGYTALSLNGNVPFKTDDVLEKVSGVPEEEFNRAVAGGIEALGIVVHDARLVELTPQEKQMIDLLINKLPDLPLNLDHIDAAMTGIQHLLNTLSPQICKTWEKPLKKLMEKVIKDPALLSCLSPDSACYQVVQKFASQNVFICDDAVEAALEKIETQLNGAMNHYSAMQRASVFSLIVHLAGLCATLPSRHRSLERLETAFKAHCKQFINASAEQIDAAGFGPLLANIVAQIASQNQLRKNAACHLVSGLPMLQVKIPQFAPLQAMSALVNKLAASNEKSVFAANMIQAASQMGLPEDEGIHKILDFFEKPKEKDEKKNEEMDALKLGTLTRLGQLAQMRSLPPGFNISQFLESIGLSPNRPTAIWVIFAMVKIFSTGYRGPLSEKAAKILSECLENILRGSLCGAFRLQDKAAFLKAAAVLMHANMIPAQEAYRLIPLCQRLALQATEGNPLPMDDRQVKSLWGALNVFDRFPPPSNATRSFSLSPVETTLLKNRSNEMSVRFGVPQPSSISKRSLDTNTSQADANKKQK